MRHALGVLACLLVDCCSLSTVGPTVDLTGSWSAVLPSGGPDSALVLVLSQRGANVTGTGALTPWVIVDTSRQTGPAIELSVAGAYEAPSLTLDLQYYLGTELILLQFFGTVQDARGPIGGRLYVSGLMESITLTRN